MTTRNTIRANPFQPRVRAARKTAQRGAIALQDLLLAVVGVAIVGSISLFAFGQIRGGVNADDQAKKVIALASEIQKNWRNVAHYGTVSPAEVNKLALVHSPLRYDGTNLQDAWGNNMSLNGGTTTFAITIGGSANAMSKEDCATVANQLGAGIATNISIGSAATVGTGTSAGQVSGGNAFKVGTTFNQNNLTTGCNEANPVIVASFR